MRFLISALLTLALSWPLGAQNEDLAALREQLAKQQKQIEELRSLLAAQQQLLENLSQKAVQPVQPVAQKIEPLTTGDRAPLSFRIGAAEFTPGGFVDFTSVFRTTNVGSGIGTTFASIPFENTAPGKLTEQRLSAQNSRVALRVTSKFGKQQLTGYLESDFLGNAPAGLNVTSNSATARLRLYWAQIVRDKWEILAGQSWSMLTPNRVGISPYPSELFITQDIDTNYQVGLTWTRAPQFRAVYHASRKWTAGLALENPEQYVGQGVVLPSFANGQFDNGSNPATPNVHPDVIGKVAYDGGAEDRPVHVEVAGLFRTFRSLRPAGGTSVTPGYAGSVNAIFGVKKNLRLILTTFYGLGGGRYIFGLAPDVVVGPDGSVSPVRSGSGIAGLEYNVRPNSVLYAYYGGTYIWRNFSQAGPGQFFGYGFPGSPNLANRSLQEVTAGYNYTFWRNPNYGALQLMTQYSYLTRSPWSVPPGSPRNTHTHMLFANLRYVLP